ncbi:sigma-70 family RNA polymerase sigma factor [Phycicoccus sp. Root101]|uniref:sigma-70 family RNA polymerase sigma factor n=1 Tax=Phycicoccus sp. Root101 TaxID=1736421 RepID=UPI0009E9AC83|nr:FliA/WhiG family RNA polymerase sigma factor [Phycicoccus sp. Root101]
MTVTGCRERGSASVDAERLCREHLAVVHYEVRSLSVRLPSHVTLDDLTSAGMAALAAAAQSFDPERGVPFGRYAARRIKGALLDELRSLDWASRSLRAKAREREAARDALSSSLRREPDDRELATHMGVSVDEVRELGRDLHQSVVLRLDALVDAGADSMLPRHSQTPEAVVVERERESYLDAAVESLPERLRVVIRATFFEDRPLKEVADELGVTESRISQIRTEALKMLKDGMNAHLDPDQLPAMDEGLVARRRAAYYAEIAGRASHRQRQTMQAAAHQGGRQGGRLGAVDQFAAGQ